MNRTISHIIILILCLCGIVSSYGSSLKKVSVNGSEYYVYESSKGDTMYGLAYKLGWDIQKIEQYNPGIVSPLDNGQLVYYPIELKENSADTQSAGGKSISTGDSELRHYVKRGETISSISRLYNVDVKTLYKLNPGSDKGIKADTWLLISKGSDADKNGKKYHTIKRGETLFGVAKQNNVSVEALMRANPGITATHFQAGDNIIIPSDGTGLKVVKKIVPETKLTGYKSYRIGKNDTWEKIAAKNGVKVEELKAANSGVEFKNKNYIGIPVYSEVNVEHEVVEVDSLENSPEGLVEIYDNLNGIEDRQTDKVTEVRVCVLLSDPEDRKDKEFLRGFLTAVDRMKNKDFKINLKVVDGQQSSIDIIEKLDEFNPNIVFVTSDSNIPDWIGEYSATSRTPVVNTLDVKDEKYLENPFMIQLITPSEYFNDMVADWILKNYVDYTLVFTGKEDANDALAQSLKSIWDSQKVRHRSVEDLKKMPLAENEKYLLYSYETKKNEVKDFLETVNEAGNRVPLARVAVVGRPNWILYEESLGELLGNNNVMIPSRFYLPKDGPESSRFTVEYRQLFEKNFQKTFPVYAAVGYDSANYFINSFGESGGDINSLGLFGNGIQSDYSLERLSNWSGLLNKLVYIVKFSPFDNIEKIKVK